MPNWRKTYGQLLYDNNVTIEETRTFVRNYLPKKLYRFRCFNEYWKNCIFNGEVYFSSSSELNDPFDCLTYVDMDKYLSHLKEEAKTRFEFLGRNREIDCYINSHGAEDVWRGMQKIRSKIGVACFTEDCTSPLMWAHYSDSHQGFCIEYETKLIKSPLSLILMPVFYDSNRYDATDAVLNGNGNTLLTPYFVKAKEWSYEKEWRMIITENIFSKIGHIADFSDKITGIYLGLDIEKNHFDEAQEIISWAKNSGIRVYKMKVHPRKYEMYPEEI